jgi:hypothetical protein
MHDIRDIFFMNDMCDMHEIMSDDVTVRRLMVGCERIKNRYMARLRHPETWDEVVMRRKD